MARAIGKQQAEQRRAEQQAAEDLPGDTWLTQACEQLSKAVGGDKQQHEGEHQLSDVAVGQGHALLFTNPRAP